MFGLIRPSRPVSLDEEHTSAAIRARLDTATAHSYLGDLVFGAFDGTVTTFAVVSGVAGADMSGSVALVLGIANLLADGFSMAAGNYLSTKSEAQLVDRARQIEERHIDEIPDGEREEIRVIYAAKGFTGETLEDIVSGITQDRRRWIDTMLIEELGLRLKAPSALRAGVLTFLAFLAAGSVPLMPFAMASQLPAQRLFGVSAIVTAVMFTLIGLTKGQVVQKSLWRSGLETLAVGAIAAVLAYVVGLELHGLVGQ